MNKEKLKKLKKYIQEYRTMVVVFIVMLLIAMFFYYDSVKKIASDEGGVYFADDVTWDNPIDITNSNIVQTYTTTRAEISYIGFTFKKEGDFADNAYVWVQVEKDKEKNIIQEWKIPINGGVAEEDNYSCVRYPMDESFIGDRGQKLNIKISVINADEKGKVYVASGKNEDQYPYGELYINGKQSNQQLAIDICGRVNYIRSIYIFVVIIFMILLLVINLGMKKSNLAVEHAFVMLALFLGGVYLVIFTPGTEPDASAHFATAYYDANVLLQRETTTSDGKVLMREVDVHKDGVSRIGRLRNINTVKENILKRADNNQITGYERGRLSVPITAHLPQSIGVSIGILIDAGATATAYLGKIFALMFYIICCYLGIRWMPFGKEIIAFVALLPFSIETATSYSYDCEVLALTMLMVGYVMHLTYVKEKITWKDIVAWCILTAWIGPCKVIYVLLGGMIAIVPKTKFKNKKIYWGTLAIVFLTGIIAIYLTRISVVSAMVGGNVEDEYYTLSMFLSDIPKGLLLIGKSIDLYMDDYLRQMFGSMYSWMDIKLPFTFVVLYIGLMLLICVKPEREQYEMTKKQKYILAGICIIISGGIVAGLMFGWTLKDSIAVEGIQGRYFLPVLPIVILMMRNKWIVVKKNMDRIAILGIGMLQYITYLKLYTFIIAR